MQTINYADKYLGQIIAAIAKAEYKDAAIISIIDKIYEDGFADGLEEGVNNS